MKARRITGQTFFVILFVLLGNSCFDAKQVKPTAETGFIDALKVRDKLETIAKQFSEAFRKQDSVAIANFYASDGMIGSVKGHDNIVSVFSKMMKNASEKGTPNLLFKINSITTDDEYVVELGKAQWIDDDGNMKHEGKYVVVWKQEGSEWKIYRDWGL